MQDQYPVEQRSMSSEITAPLMSNPELIWLTQPSTPKIETLFRHQLSTLFGSTLSQVYFSQFTSGRSGANVWQAVPYYGFCEGAAVVLKVGEKERIAREQDNYMNFVAPYIHESSCQLRYISREDQSILMYHFIGGSLTKTVSFAEYFAKQNAASICQVIDNLFRETCQLWYDNRAAGRRIENLVRLYEAGLHIDWPEIWTEAAKTEIELTAETLTFPDLPGTFINPKWWLEQREYMVCRPVFLSMTHGDLNDHNILISKAGQCWLIDFSRTGWNHILRDVVGLENTIKLRLAETVNLVDYYDLEMLLARQTRLDQPHLLPNTHPYHKVVTTINHLRYLADILTGTTPGIAEYYEALLLTTLNSLRYHSLSKQQAQQALLSAALLCEYLDALD